MAKVTLSIPTVDDIQWITQKTEESLIVKPFKALNVKELFELTPWSLTVKQDGTYKAYVAFLDHPTQQYEPARWTEQLRETFVESQFEGLNTIFLHFLFCESEEYLRKILKLTFHSIPSLEWCCFITQPSDEVDPLLLGIFHQDNELTTTCFQFWYSGRSDYIKDVGIRSKRSEDYLSLRNMFSQIYGPFSGNDSVMKLTLDFLDYGEDKCPTYKYFTYDDDNTYIGIADLEGGDPVGFIYATLQRADLDVLNAHFQLEAVYGLRKIHPNDTPGISFDRDYVPMPDEPSSGEELGHSVLDLINEAVDKWDIVTLLSDVLDEVCGTIQLEPKKEEDKAVDENIRKLFNSEVFDLANNKHLNLITKQNVKHFETNTLIRLVNSPSFDNTNEAHMKLVPLLDKAIQDINKDRINEIMNSDLFDPSKEDFAKVSLHVMGNMPEDKLQLFRKSAVGADIYEKLKYQKALARKKRKKHKLSFKDIQAIKHHEDKLKRSQRKSTQTSLQSSSETHEAFRNRFKFKNISHRNMGFISGIAVRGRYRVQGNFKLPKIKEPFGYVEHDSERKQTDSQQSIKTETSDKYPVRDMEREGCAVQEIPNYFGATNCFFVEQFAIEEEHEAQSLYLIMAGFEYFPRVDYCIILLPYGTTQVPYLRRYFVPIPARPFSSYGKELYVFHKGGFGRPYQVRLYQKTDYQGVRDLIMSSCLKEYLLNDLEQTITLDGRQVQSVVLRSEDQIFGIAIVTDIKEVEIIRRNYDIGEHINMKYHKYRNHGQLLHCVLHPVAKFLASMFLKEVMRLCQKSILYYKIYPTHIIPYNPSLWQSLCNILEQFLPLKPVKKLFAKPAIAMIKSEEKKKPRISEADKNYSLCYTCTKLVLQNKRTISSRIVVIGDSDVALGVLENLIYRHDYKYNNLTVVSKCGLLGEFHMNEKCYSFLPIRADYPKSKLDGLCLSAWVTVVRATVVSIERSTLRLKETKRNKPKHFLLGFDYLIICADFEFQTTYVKKATLKPIKKAPPQYSMLKNLLAHTYRVARNASNVFSINNAEEATHILNWLGRYFKQKEESKLQKKKYTTLAEMEREKREGRIVLYGNHIQAYTALAVLISEVFPHSKITLIKTPHKVEAFHTHYLEEVIDFVIQKTGSVDMHSNAVIEYNKECEEVANLDVITAEKTTRLDCCAILLFHEANVNHNMFKTLHHSALSFCLPLKNSKGHPYLLVNGKFETNVENVFAAGTLVEMHAENGCIVRFEDCRYNPREVGMAVAENMSRAATKKLPVLNTSLPILRNPVVTYAKLPYEYVYILITAPSKEFVGAKDGKKQDIPLKLLVLGNLRTGAAIVPAETSDKEEDADSSEQQSQDDESILPPVEKGGVISKKEKHETRVGKMGKVVPKKEIDEVIPKTDEAIKETKMDDAKSEIGKDNLTVQTGKIKKISKTKKNTATVETEKDEAITKAEKNETTRKTEKDEAITKTEKDEGTGEKDETIPETKNNEATAKTEKDDLVKTEVTVIKRIIPDKPEYFLIAFDEYENVESIESLTKAQIDIRSLISLYGTNVSQLYKLIKKVKEKDFNKVSFCLADDWILPLDYLMFEDEDAKTDIGYEGYWRCGYPAHIEGKLNSLLNSFSDYKQVKSDDK